jgi:hypothetical protein
MSHTFTNKDLGLNEMGVKGMKWGTHKDTVNRGVESREINSGGITYSSSGLESALVNIESDLRKSHFHPSMRRARVRERNQVLKMLGRKS